MYESKNKKLAPTRVFARRFLLNFILGVLILFLCLWMGMFGYHYYEKMSWIDSYENAAMILSGMGPVQELKTSGGKIFAGTYALFSGIVFIFFMTIILAPILHRFYHQFHLSKDQPKDKD